METADTPAAGEDIAAATHAEQRIAETASHLLPAERVRSFRLLRLEAVRGFAATYIVLHHLKGSAGGGLLEGLLSFGQEQVIVFFLLSGFVIHYSSSGKRLPSAGDYYLRRFRRIYPLFLLSLLWTYVWSKIVYSTTPFNAREFVGNLLMLQDTGAFKRGTWFEPFMRNAPLWSLSYECFFYLCFFPVFIGLATRPRAQRWLVFVSAAVGFLSYEAWPNQLSLFLAYFGIWWQGVELSREYASIGRVTWRGQAVNLAWAAVLAGLWATPVWIAHHQGQAIHVGLQPFLQFRHFATALVVLLLAIAWHRVRFVGFWWIFAPFVPVAAVSYALYIFHYPVVRSMDAMGIHALWLQILASAVILVPVIYLLEVKLQAVLNRWIRWR